MANTPEIEALLALHRIDSEIDKLTSQKKLLPLALRRIETRLARQRQSLEEKKESIKHLRADTHSKEVTLRGAEEEVSKLATQLNRVSTNKEYAALQHEIAAKKADASRIEDQVLMAMADLEQLEREVRELDQSISQIQREQADEAKGIDKDVADLDRRIGELHDGRSGAAGKVDPALLDEYERVAAKRGASALAPVVGNACQGCFMQLPPQMGHSLRGGRDIVRCPSCTRILYLP
jgi:predicted  nucleic acid-binding Zn-ribbon protein